MQGRKEFRAALEKIHCSPGPGVVIESDGAKELMQDEASYICTSCGEEIVLPIDLSAGESQEYTEDCPVCCHPNLIRIEVSESGDVRAWAEKESD